MVLYLAALQNQLYNMHIGYDGKRAFQNKTGLGNYIRSLMATLTTYYPANLYTLFAPKKTGLFDPGSFKKVDAIFPKSKFYSTFPSLWRRRGMIKAIEQSGIDLYHGVSNELPYGIEKTNVKSVVTVHDIIYERFPETYHFDERYVNRWKIKYACRVANAVIAISDQTKKDLIEYYKVPAEKIFICYQNCNPIFQRSVDDQEKTVIKRRYDLPDQYFLFVSSIAPRKNLIAVCRALAELKNQINIPLVVIGNGKKEKAAAKAFMAQNGVSNLLILLNELPQSKESNFTTAADFPGIYQQALALIYPSIFEGFGAPLLEALWSGIPVLSSNTSSLPEVAGDAALYFAPDDIAMLAKHIHRIATDKALVTDLKERGLKRAQMFTGEKHAQSIMEVYQKIIR